MNQPKRYGILLPAVFFFVTVLHADYSIAVRNSNRIKPGIGVGRILLGEKYQDIAPILNREHDDMRKAGEGADAEMHLSYEKMGLTLIYDAANKHLKKILVTNKALLIDQTDISVGSSASQLRKYLKKQRMEPSIEVRAGRRPIEIWDFEEEGIAFWIDQDDQIIIAIEIKRGEK